MRSWQNRRPARGSLVNRRSREVIGDVGVKSLDLFCGITLHAIPDRLMWWV